MSQEGKHIAHAETDAAEAEAAVVSVDGAPLAAASRIGRFQVLDKLGSGGMSDVWLAFDPELDRKVAIKVLRTGRGAQERLRREAQVLARLSHEHVIVVYDVGVLDERLYLVEEHLDGGTLAGWLAREKRPWRRTLEPFLAAGRGLAAAHAAGVVHRDFKPDNVLLGRDGRVRVTDFGLARARVDDDDLPSVDTISGVSSPPSPELTREGAILGTPAYMAPEQHLGGKADARSDQFAFCIALYHALYGERPYAGTSSAALIKNPVREPPPSAVPSWLRRALLRGLSRRRGDRYPDMQALLHDLAPERRARARRLLVAGALLAVGAGVAVPLVLHQMRAAPVCRGGEAKLDGVWDAPRRGSVRAAFVATGRPYAADAFATVSAALDRWREAWVVMDRDACEATRIRRDQSEALLDRRMACLADRRREVAALVDELQRADAAVVERAAAAMSSLPSLAPCADVDLLHDRLKPPAEIAAAVDAARLRLARGQALSAVGRVQDALAVARDVAAEAQRLGWPVLRVESGQSLAFALYQAGDQPGAERVFLEAIPLAEAARLDEAVAQMLVQLVFVLGAQNRTGEATRWGRVAEGALARAGNLPRLEGTLHNSLATVAAAEGRPGDALREEERAVALWEASPDTVMSLAQGLVNLGDDLRALGRLDEARPPIERAIALVEKAVGPHHPTLAMACNNLALVAKAQGKLDEATALLERALAIREGAYGEDSAEAAESRANLGNLHLLRGELVAAEAEQRKVLRVFETRLGPAHARVGLTHNNLADVILAAGRTAEARDEYARAREIVEAALGPKHPLLAYPLVGEGRCRTLLGDAAGAIPLLERALAVRAAAQVTEEPLADARFALAQALWDGGGDRRRARTLAEAALAGYEGLGPTAAAAAAPVRAWLKER